jgi:hypothetical protein
MNHHEVPGLDEMPLTATIGDARAILRPIGSHGPGQAVRGEAAR